MMCNLLIPADTKYCAAGHPMPPIPTNVTFFFLKIFKDFSLNSFNIRCLENISNSCSVIFIIKFYELYVWIQYHQINLKNLHAQSPFPLFPFLSCIDLEIG